MRHYRKSNTKIPDLPKWRKGETVKTKATGEKVQIIRAYPNAQDHMYEITGFEGFYFESELTEI